MLVHIVYLDSSSFVSRLLFQVCGCTGGCPLSAIMAGMEWAIVTAQASPDEKWVGNMSLGGGANDMLDESVQEAINAGIIIVVAAGNDSKDACENSPAVSMMKVELVYCVLWHSLT